MAAKPWKLSDITQRDVLDMKKPFEVAVLPFGSTEPHNYHLPYGSDAYEADMIADRICEKAWHKGAKVVCLPSIPYGLNWNLIKFPMTIHMNPSTHLAIIRDIVRSLEAHNIRKLMILNSHGGNEFKGLIREVYAESNIFICLSDWWTAAPEKEKEVFEKRAGDHANEMETSVCMALIPDLVRLELADPGAFKKTRFKAVNNGTIWLTRPWDRLTGSSGCGDPSRSSAEKGAAFLNSVEEEISNFLVELSDAEMDETFPF